MNNSESKRLLRTEHKLKSHLKIQTKRNSKISLSDALSWYFSVWYINFLTIITELITWTWYEEPPFYEGKDAQLGELAVVFFFASSEGRWIASFNKIRIDEDTEKIII